MEEKVEYGFDEGFDVMKWIFGILATLITMAMAGNFTNDYIQSRGIDDNRGKINVLEERMISHTKEMDIKSAEADDLIKMVTRMDKNQLLIMRALRIPPVKE